MAKQMIGRMWSAQTLLWLALVLALVGSLRHVAWGFSTLEQGDLLAGYIQAIAVDLGLFALALGIQNRKRHTRSTRWLWAGVLLFSAVSTYANLLHGLYFQTDLGLQSWHWLVSIRPVILSGVLPLLVVYLSEVAGDDVNHLARLAEREARKEARQAQTLPEPTGMAAGQVAPNTCPGDQLRVQSTSVVDDDALALARTVKAEQDAQAKAERVGKLLALCASTPDIGVTELAAQLGVSRTAVYGYVKELTESGRLTKNGKGWEVLTIDDIGALPVATVDIAPAAN